MGGGSNKVDQAMNADNNDTTEITSEQSNQVDKDINSERCAADIEIAKTNADAEIKASENELKAVELQCETDKYVADLESEAKMEELKNDAQRIATVDVVNAQANLTSANAEVDTAEAKKIKAEGDSNDNSSSSYQQFYS